MALQHRVAALEQECDTLRQRELGFQAFLAENLLCALQPLTLLSLRQRVIKKGVRNRPRCSLENQGPFLVYVPIIYAFLFDQQNE